MKSIAIITARGGSKRIPNKNIKEFCGKPIISYSIEAAIKSGEFDEIMVSTDSKKIADIALQYGAEVPFFRSETTSTDYATTAEVIKEVLDKYEGDGKKYDIVCCLYPTAPFITAEKLKNAMEMLGNTGSASVIPVVQYSFPPQRGLVISDGKIQYKYPQFANARSQDLQPIYHDCGQFYVCRVDSFREQNTLITQDTVPLVFPEEEVQDIDNLSDWALAEAKYKTFILKGEE